MSHYIYIFISSSRHYYCLRKSRAKAAAATVATADVIIDAATDAYSIHAVTVRNIDITRVRLSASLNTDDRLAYMIYCICSVVFPTAVCRMMDCRLFVMAPT